MGCFRQKFYFKKVLKRKFYLKKQKIFLKRICFFKKTNFKRLNFFIFLKRKLKIFFNLFLVNYFLLSFYFFKKQKLLRQFFLALDE